MKHPYRWPKTRSADRHEQQTIRDVVAYIEELARRMPRASYDFDHYNRPRWFDRKGEPIGAHMYEVLHRDENYVRVAQTTIETALGNIWISTVWLGLNHSWRDGEPPLIFETMVFDQGENSDSNPLDENCWRYPNEVAALAGHDQVVELVRASLTLKETE